MLSEVTANCPIRCRQIMPRVRLQPFAVLVLAEYIFVILHLLYSHLLWEELFSLL